MKKLLTLLCLVLFLTACSAKSANGVSYYYEPSADAAETADYGVYAKNEDDPVSYNRVENSAEKIIYTGNIRIETKDYDSFLNEFNALTAKYHGIVQSMSENNYGERRYLSYTLRIPAERFEEYLEEVRNGSGSVTSVSSNAENITRRYSDNELRIETLKTQHERLLELLDEAAGLSDVIMIEDRLSEVEYELNSLTSYKQDMDEDVTYATVYVSIEEVMIYTKTSFGKRVKDAIGDSFRNFISGVQDFLIDVIYALPMLMVLAVLFFVLRKPVKTLLKKIPKRTPKKKEE